MKLIKVISGAQTGADRAGLDAAIEANLPYGGWVPKGRRSEDGQVPEKYILKETGASGYLVRTRLNVTCSDATVVFTHGKPKQGSMRTIEIAVELNKPNLHINLSDTTGDAAVDLILSWLDKLPQGRGVLNVAGSRESSWPTIGEEVKYIMLNVIAKARA
jgi:hypothetical protein